jgi:DNA-binding PadR family transcriptional regulator
MSRLSPDEVLLGLLQAHPAHGYDLLERFRDPAHLGRVWNMSVSQLYAVLKRLESDGTITGRELPQSDAPPRTEYAITPLGEQRVADWLAETQPPTSIHRIRVQFLSRLYIATLLDLPTEGIIDRQLAVCEKQRDAIRERLAQTSAPIETLTLEFVQGQLEAAITWLQRCREHPLTIPDEINPSA